VGTDFPAECRSNLDNTDLSEVHRVSSGRLHDAFDPGTPPLWRIPLTTALLSKQYVVTLRLA
jgi:hypothetical protein